MISKLRRNSVVGHTEARAYTEESLVKDQVKEIVRLVWDLS
jgi:hypothetical protein